MFKFIMCDKDQNKHTILYDQHTSKMIWEETGNLVVANITYSNIEIITNIIEAK